MPRFEGLVKTAGAIGRGVRGFKENQFQDEFREEQLLGLKSQREARGLDNEIKRNSLKQTQIDKAAAKEILARLSKRDIEGARTALGKHQSLGMSETLSGQMFNAIEALAKTKRSEAKDAEIKQANNLKEQGVIFQGALQQGLVKDPDANTEKLAERFFLPGGGGPNDLETFLGLVNQFPAIEQRAQLGASQQRSATNTANKPAQSDSQKRAGRAGFFRSVDETALRIAKRDGAMSADIAKLTIAEQLQRLDNKGSRSVGITEDHIRQAFQFVMNGDIEADYGPNVKLPTIEEVLGQHGFLPPPHNISVYRDPLSPQSSGSVFVDSLGAGATGLFPVSTPPPQGQPPPPGPAVVGGGQPPPDEQGFDHNAFIEAINVRAEELGIAPEVFAKQVLDSNVDLRTGKALSPGMVSALEAIIQSTTPQGGNLVTGAGEEQALSFPSGGTPGFGELAPRPEVPFEPDTSGFDALPEAPKVDRVEVRELQAQREKAEGSIQKIRRRVSALAQHLGFYIGQFEDPKEKLSNRRKELEKEIANPIGLVGDQEGTDVGIDRNLEEIAQINELEQLIRIVRDLESGLRKSDDQFRTKFHGESR